MALTRSARCRLGAPCAISRALGSALTAYPAAALDGTWSQEEVEVPSTVQFPSPSALMPTAVRPLSTCGSSPTSRWRRGRGEEKKFPAMSVYSAPSPPSHLRGESKRRRKHARRTTQDGQFRTPSRLASTPSPISSSLLALLFLVAAQSVTRPPAAAAAAALSEMQTGSVHAADLAVPRRVLTPLYHPDEALRTCEVALSSEQPLPDISLAPGGLSQSVVQGSWAYQRTSAGVRRHSLLPSDSGTFDLWVEESTESDRVRGMNEVAVLMYVSTRQPDGSPGEGGGGGEGVGGGGGVGGTAIIRGEGFYSHKRGMLCMVACLDAANSFLETMPPIVQEGVEVAGEEAFVGGGAGGGGEPEWRTVPTEEPPPVDDEKCKMRTVLRFRIIDPDGPDTGHDRSTVTGRFESLHASTDAEFFSPIVIQAEAGEMATQISWFQYEMYVESALMSVQLLCLIFQVFYSRRDSEAVNISLSFLGVQIVVLTITWFRGLYYPLRFIHREVLIYFLSDAANIPRFIDFAMLLTYLALAFVVYQKRRSIGSSKQQRQHQQELVQATVMASAAAAVTEPSATRNISSGSSTTPAIGQPGSIPDSWLRAERQVAVFVWPLFLGLAAVIWVVQRWYEDTFMRLCSFAFLLPQLAANAMWDLPAPSVRAVTGIFAVGATLSQVMWLTYEVVRPRLMGYDAFFAFPHAWYWSSMALMVLLLVVYVAQARAGGRLTAWRGSRKGYGAVAAGDFA